MAGEHTIVIEKELPIDFTCAEATGIEKGTLMTLADPMTASATTTQGASVCGVCAVEKISGDGMVKVAVYTRGIFKGYCSGGVTVGQALKSSATANYLEANGVDGEEVVGRALETATEGETFLYELNPTHINQA